MVLIFILIYFEWRDTENQQLEDVKQKKCLTYENNFFYRLPKMGLVARLQFPRPPSLMARNVPRADDLF